MNVSGCAKRPTDSRRAPVVLQPPRVGPSGQSCNDTEGCVRVHDFPLGVRGAE
jgi:hypothetical protein